MHFRIKNQGPPRDIVSRQLPRPGIQLSRADEASGTDPKGDAVPKRIRNQSPPAEPKLAKVIVTSIGELRRLAAEFESDGLDPIPEPSVSGKISLSRLRESATRDPAAEPCVEHNLTPSGPNSPANDPAPSRVWPSPGDQQDTPSSPAESDRGLVKAPTKRRHRALRPEATNAGESSRLKLLSSYDPAQRLLTSTELAALLKCSVRTLEGHRLRDRGIPYARIEGMVRYPMNEIENYVRDGLRGR